MAWPRLSRGSRFARCSRRFALIATMACCVPAGGQTAGGALLCDGVDDQVTIPDMSGDLDLAFGLTVETWVRFDDLAKATFVVGGFHPPDAGDFGLGALRPSGQPAFTVSTPGTNTAFGPPLAAGVWTHLAGTYDGTTLRLYVNGVLAGSVPHGGDVSDVTELRVCRHPREISQFLDGAIDEVRVWRVARSAGEILANYRRRLAGDEPGLVAYYRFDEGSGQVVFDSAGGGNDGVLGKTGSAGSDDPVRVVSGAPLVAFTRVCGENLVLPFYLADKSSPNGTNTLFAVRNLTVGSVPVDVEYFTPGGTSQRLDSLVLEPHKAATLSTRDVPGLAVDGDGFARGFVRILAAGRPDGGPALAGDFFQADVGNNFATGDRLVRQSELCSDASIRFLDFGAGTRLVVWLANPRGTGAGVPPSFTVQAYDEAGLPAGGPTAVKTSSHALDLQASDFTNLAFGSLDLDFTNSFGGVAYAEYSAEGRFSVGLASDCNAPQVSEAAGCCPPGAPKAVALAVPYPRPQFDDCETASSEALRDLDAFAFRNACQAAYGGPLADAVLGAGVVDCQVTPNNVKLDVEVCCPPI